MIRKLALAALAAGLLSTPALAADKLKVEISKGCSFDITLRPDLAPKHVAQITKLAKEGFYNGIIFHRVIEGFMAQTGDPTGTGMGGYHGKVASQATVNRRVQKAASGTFDTLQHPWLGLAGFVSLSAKSGAMKREDLR